MSSPAVTQAPLRRSKRQPCAGTRQLLAAHLASVEPEALVRAGAVDRADAVVGADHEHLAGTEHDRPHAAAGAELGDGAGVAHAGGLYSSKPCRSGSSSSPATKCSGSERR